MGGGAGSLSIIDAPAVEADSSHFGEITCVHRDGELIYRSELASIRDTCIIETSQSNIKEEETLVSFKVSPHPLHGISNIQFTRPMHVFKMSLFDLRGKLIFSEDVNQQIQTMKFSSEELRDGVYFLRIYSENGVQVSKLIKQ